MKAVLSWSLMAIFMSSANFSYAGDSPSRALLISKLKDKVYKLIDSRELKTITCDAETVRIDFRIDEEGLIQVKETSTENKVLEHYIFARLDEQHHHQTLSGEKFVIKIDFKASR